VSVGNQAFRYATSFRPSHRRAFARLPIAIFIPFDRGLDPPSLTKMIRFGVNGNYDP